MKFGTLYTHAVSPRAVALLATARTHNLNLEIIHTEQEEHPTAYQKLLAVNSLGQVPTFVGADGFVLTEFIPITLYFAAQNDTTTLLGPTRRSNYEILKWMSFTNSDLLPAIGGCLLPQIEKRQVIRQDHNDSVRALRARCAYLDQHLHGKGFLVGEQLTVADFFVAGALIGAYMAWDVAMWKRYPALSKWFRKIVEVQVMQEVVGELDHFGLPFPAVRE
ncbi:glutathione S-transferase [Aspergillus karnatakaensis]|uniref:glutathione S-transferase family protein n=1 Tax=Aspergillus karnatakaensis TaxID=1810916 RepID=UPI003CCDCE0E